MNKFVLLLCTVVSCNLLLIAIHFSIVNAEPTDFAFPVIGDSQFRDDFEAPRSGGRTHQATDIIADKHQKIIATVSGTISFAPLTQPSYGWLVVITDDDGYKYRYIHLNNDTPGTDNGKGSLMFTYAPYVANGRPIVRGQHIGYVGDSGNAEDTVSHLHFEIERPDGSFVNPYEELTQATRKSKPIQPPAYSFEAVPYGGLEVDLNVATGDIDGDGAFEVVSAPGTGAGPHLKVFDENYDPVLGFFAYKSSLRMGIDAALGDIDGDGDDEIITSPGPGGGPHIRVFDGDGEQISGFFAYNNKFRGGVRVAAGDVDNDGEDEIITGPMAGGGPHVKAYEFDGTPVVGLFAYDPSLRMGIDVAAGDIDGDGDDEIITSPGPGGGPHIRVFDGDGSLAAGFFAYDKKFRGGVRVSSGNIYSSSASYEIATIPETTGGSQAKIFSGDGVFQDDQFALERWWRGHYDIAINEDTGFSGTGFNRRASIVNIFD